MPTTSNPSTQRRLERVPVALRDLLECIIKPESVDSWLQNPESFREIGTTPLQLLFEAAASGDRSRFATDLGRIATPFYRAIGYASAPGVLPLEALIGQCWKDLSPLRRKHVAQLKYRLREYYRGSDVRRHARSGKMVFVQIYSAEGKAAKRRDRVLVPS